MYRIPRSIACAGVSVIVLAAALAIWYTTSGANQRHAQFTGTIQLGPDGDNCQRFVIDNKTGFIRHDQPVACGEPARDSKRESAKVKDSKRDSAKAPNRAPEGSEPRYSSGARIDAVRDSFYKR